MHATVVLAALWGVDLLVLVALLLGVVSRRLTGRSPGHEAFASMDWRRRQELERAIRNGEKSRVPELAKVAAERARFLRHVYAIQFWAWPTLFLVPLPLMWSTAAAGLVAVQALLGVTLMVLSGHQWLVAWRAERANRETGAIRSRTVRAANGG